MPILRAYDDNCTLYNAFAKKAEMLIGEILSSANVKVHAITSRVKTRESLENKLKKKQHYTQIDHITDICGVRIIAFTTEDVSAIVELIENEFSVDINNSIDKGKALDPDRFGYLSVHHVVGFSSERLSLREYERFRDLKLEVQTRSILQHAWAEIEHDLGYKSTMQVPIHIRRRFTLVAGLLELADREFVGIKGELDEYAGNVQTQLDTGVQAIGIDKVSLELYIKGSELVQDLDNEIAPIINYDISENVTFDITGGIFQLGITTISDLNLILERERRNIIEFTKAYVDQWPKPQSGVKYGSVSKGVSLSTFILMRIGQKQNNEYAASFLKSMGYSEPEAIAKQAIEAAKIAGK